MKVYVSAILSIFLLVGCSEEPQTDQGLNIDGEPQETLGVILITDVGGLGDKGFNDAGWEGCQDAKQRLSEQGVNVEARVIESREQSDYSENLAMAAERADVVVALGFLIADAVEAIAPNYPDTAFIFIDGAVPGENVASFVFRSNEAAFLGGIITAYMTETNVVGVMPGMDIPPVENYAAGYRAGVQMGAALQNKNINSLSSTIGSFTDPVKAKSIAQSLLGQNADIILQLAGISGLGVIEAVKEHSGRAFAVGGDINQDDLAPGQVLYSILKRMDLVVSDQIVAVYEDRFEGGNFNVGLDEGYVGLSDMAHTEDMIPGEAFEAKRKAEAFIISEELVPPSTYAELELFDPPVDLFDAP